MADGIKIHDVAAEISPAGLEALVQQRGAEVTVTRLDLSVSQEALNVLLHGLAPEGAAAPSAQVDAAGLRLALEREGKPLSLDLQVGGLRLEFTGDGLRLASGPARDGG
jgi:hypothetical protein